jgi:cysteine sulfinate desulfinase/cysteine desulfurase-like protein
MNIPSEWAMGTLRFSVGRETTVAEIDQAIKTICFVLRDFGSS